MKTAEHHLCDVSIWHGCPPPHFLEVSVKGPLGALYPCQYENMSVFSQTIKNVFIQITIKKPVISNGF
jgi:hypothetical protein